MKFTKTTLAMLLIVGVLALSVTLTQAVQLSGVGMYLFFLGVGFAVFVIWDRVLFRDVDTVREIVDDQNVALAILYLVPALLVLSASLAT